MANIGRPKTELILTQQEREELQRLARRSRSSRHLAFRAKVILQCADNKLNTAVAQSLHTTNATVGKWRSRFVGQRMDGLYDEPRPGAPRKISDKKIEEVVTKTLESTPRGRTHWSTRSTWRRARCWENATRDIGRRNSRSSSSKSMPRYPAKSTSTLFSTTLPHTKHRPSSAG